MMEKFMALDNNKKQKIINAALKEFAENGYEKASTNRIVKEAGIGKGMLFYYFTNKQALYDYLAEYSLDIIVTQYFDLVSTNETDFIERLKKMAEVKIKAQSENRDVFNFIGILMLPKDSELPSHVRKKYEEMQRLGSSMLYEGIDMTLFRNDVDVEKVFKLIRWSIDGYQNELLHRLEGKNLAAIDFGPYWEEFYDYLDILKKSFYREGERGK